MKFKKISVCIVYLILTLSFFDIYAMVPAAPVAIGVAASVGGTAIGFVQPSMSFIDKLRKRRLDIKEAKKYGEEIKKYSGYRSKNEIADNLQAILDGKSPIKIYGQDEAKKDCHRFLTVVLDEIFNNISSRRPTSGNVVYIIGPPGTGKTVMANAIANAFLKYPEYTCCIICPEQAKSDSSSGASGDLASRLFKVVNKIVNLEKKPKEPSFVQSMLGNDHLKQSSQLVYAPVPYHLLKWNGEAVIILDDYHSMKTSTSQFTNQPMYDHSADEIFRSIVSNGYYMLNGEKIDCSKALFIITSNETKDEIYKNFGEGGIACGAPRRLNIIQFNSSDPKFGKRLVSNMVSEICFTLTNKSDIYNVKNVTFSENTINQMADYVTNDIKQGGAIKDLKGGILSVCSQHRKEYAYKSIEISYVPGTQNTLGYFTSRVLEKSSRVSKANNSSGSKEKKKNFDFEINSNSEGDPYVVYSDDENDNPYVIYSDNENDNPYVIYSDDEIDCFNVGSKE